MSPYAEHTTVAADRSRAELERVLIRYGAQAFAYGWDGPNVVVGFRMRDRQIRFRPQMPDRQDPQFTETSRGDPRSPRAAETLYDQATRQRWRALLLVVKAKLEAVAIGITSFEEEFLSSTVTPDGSTVGDWLRPQLAAAYETGQMPALLPALPAPSGQR